MAVLVCDSSVLIEFSKRALLGEMFGLDFQFAVPDLLFDDELIDLGPYGRQDLLNWGLRVETLDPAAMEAAIAYQSGRPVLSLVDSFALALAGRRGWPLLTEDRLMRRVAQSEGIPHHDALWAVDRMFEAGILAAGRVVTTLEAMRNDPRCPVPERDLSERIGRLGGAGSASEPVGDEPIGT